MSFFRDLFTIGPDSVMAGTHRHERPRWMGRYGGSDDEGSGYRDVGTGKSSALAEVTACGVSRMVSCRATNYSNASTIP
jgi:hypothetical protein